MWTEQERDYIVNTEGESSSVCISVTWDAHHHELLVGCRQFLMSHPVRLGKQVTM